MEIKFIPIYIEFEKEKEEKIVEKIKKIIEELKVKKITVATITPYSRFVERIINRIKKESNVNILEFYNEKTGEKNVVLGCYANIPKECDVVIFIGDGLFHPKGIANFSQKLVITIDPFSLKVHKVFPEVRESKVLFYFEKSKNIGIFTSIKPGQRNIKLAEKIKKILEEKYQGKKFYLFIGDNFSESVINNFIFIDLWICLACPRIVDDYFPKVISLTDLIKTGILEKNEI